MTIQNNVLSRIIARSSLRNTVPQYRSHLFYHRDLASPSVYLTCGEPYPAIPGSRYFCYRSLRVRFSLDKLEDASMGDRGVLAGKRAEESPSGQQSLSLLHQESNEVGFTLSKGIGSNGTTDNGVLPLQHSTRATGTRAQQGEALVNVVIMKCFNVEVSNRSHWVHGLRLLVLLVVLPLGFVLDRSSDAAEPLEQFLQEHCIRCHGPQKELSSVRIDQLSRDFRMGPDWIAGVKSSRRSTVARCLRSQSLDLASRRSLSSLPILMQDSKRVALREWQQDPPLPITA